MAVKLTWGTIEKEVDTLGLPAHSGISRAIVPDGWLIWAFGAKSDSLVFLPTPNHEWK